ncbi:protein FRA10AC1-like isoform X1 [Acipenser oxyrinchus oxyrinchus]|uniref:Protein FRA10AC1-like isoform X1 n=1 Tax=Acipenser oxyrinchus oxyrinchus TaxID=40147 RepID=A0AAD8DB52_ACIOX|nr:protein FRA10AC1-like isoform X1 [Acipenser oxyrinchus oxyrinchus]
MKNKTTVSSTQSLNLVKVHGIGGYDSDFSDDEIQEETSDQKKKRIHKDDPLLQKAFQKGKHAKLVHKHLAAQEWDRLALSLISSLQYDRHKKFVSDYILFYGGKEEDFKRFVEKDKTDVDVIKENHRFLWREEDEDDMTWEQNLAKKYYDKLFKEYCIADLSRYKENKFGFRWQVEKEVVSGKGQFFCGNKNCDTKEGLKTFGYVEQGEKRNALVKLHKFIWPSHIFYIYFSGLCPECSYKLNFHHRRKEVEQKKRQRTEDGEDEPLSKKSKSSVTKKHRSKGKRKGKGKGNGSWKEEKTLKTTLKEISSNTVITQGPSDADYWKGPAPSIDEKTREEEFDDYFQDMFL